MPDLKTYDLFISHAWKYGEEYSRLVSLLKGAPYFKYRNYSAPEDKPLQNLDSSDVTTQAQIAAAIKTKNFSCEYRGGYRRNVRKQSSVDGI